jgi:hypothetical protein
MIRLLTAFLVTTAGCASQRQLAETPTAMTRRTPAEAPPANSSDAERAQMVQSRDDVLDTMAAQREVRQAGREARQRRAQEPPPVPPVPVETPNASPNQP